MSKQTVKVEDAVLTTVDNPWNPFTNWDEWYAYDELKGYNTSGLLARFVITSNDISEADNFSAILEGMNEIVKLNPLGIHYILRSTDEFISPYDRKKLSEELVSP